MVFRTALLIHGELFCRSLLAGDSKLATKCHTLNRLQAGPYKKQNTRHISELLTVVKNE